MDQFLGTHQNRLDAKGRVSIPAPFRAALRALGGSNGEPAQLILLPSLKHTCIEGWPAPVFKGLSAPLERLDLFSEPHDDMATSLYADAYPVEPDREGRIVLPEALVAHAGLQSNVVFMGHGRIFKIWEPGAAEARRNEARERVRSRGMTLPGTPAAGHA